MTVGSLFSGIGGLDLGLERAGFAIKFQVEIDEFCRRVLVKHWPDVRRWDDVRTFPSEPKEDWNVDLICGGFPCQDISFAGRGAGLAGRRSGLWYEFARVVRELRPRYVLVENVAALLVRGLDAVLGTLAALGYDAEWHCIPAAAVGAPHVRDRVFILAYTEGRDNLRRMAENAERSGQATKVLGSRPPGTNWWDTEPDVGRVADGVPVRMDRLRGLGNAVVPQVAEWIGRRIMEAQPS